MAFPMGQNLGSDEKTIAKSSLLMILPYFEFQTNPRSNSTGGVPAVAHQRELVQSSSRFPNLGSVRIDPCFPSLLRHR
jgi:hypothetical protein